MLEIEKEQLNEQLKNASYVALWELGDANNIWQKATRRKHHERKNNSDNEIICNDEYI